MLLIDTGEQRQVPHLMWIFRTVGFGVSDCRLRTGVGEWVGGWGRWEAARLSLSRAGLLYFKEAGSQYEGGEMN